MTVPVLPRFTRSAFLLGVLALPGLAHANLAPPSPTAFPLAISAMRARTYPGSALTPRQTLRSGSNYSRAVVSYQSDGLRINALLTVPNGTPPKGGWPAIVFNHGYIPPDAYRTTERYVAYVDAFARAGFVVLKPDYRGHGLSEGTPSGAYWSPDYTTDVLNAFSSLQRYKNVNPQRIGMWGHSMGGHLTLRAMVVNPQIKAGNIWAGVVVDYAELLQSWRGRRPPSGARSRRAEVVAHFGTPQQNPQFWQAVSPNFFLKSLQGRPIELHHGSGDADVPVGFSQSLSRQLQRDGQRSELYVYPGDNHNLSGHLGVALRRSVDFFKTNL